MSSLDLFIGLFPYLPVSLEVNRDPNRSSHRCFKCDIPLLFQLLASLSSFKFLHTVRYWPRAGWPILLIQFHSPWSGIQSFPFTFSGRPLAQVILPNEIYIFWKVHVRESSFSCLVLTNMTLMSFKRVSVYVYLSLCAPYPSLIFLSSLLLGHPFIKRRGSDN